MFVSRCGERLHKQRVEDLKWSSEIKPPLIDAAANLCHLRGDAFVRRQLYQLVRASMRNPVSWILAVGFASPSAGGVVFFIRHDQKGEF